MPPVALTCWCSLCLRQHEINYLSCLFDCFKGPYSKCCIRKKLKHEIISFRRVTKHFTFLLIRRMKNSEVIFFRYGLTQELKPNTWLLFLLFLLFIVLKLGSQWLPVALLIYGSRIAEPLHHLLILLQPHRGPLPLASTEARENFAFPDPTTMPPPPPQVSFFSNQVTFLSLNQSLWPRELWCFHWPGLVTWLLQNLVEWKQLHSSYMA